MVRDITEIMRIVATEILHSEVESLAGGRHAREKPHDGAYVRHGTNLRAAYRSVSSVYRLTCPAYVTA